MLLVAVDTSGKKGSLALCRGDQDSFETLHLISLDGGTYSAVLIPRLSEALGASGLYKTDIDGFVVISGPGSFTGLRVGLSTVKGLCEVLQKPLAVVSMLEALALANSEPGQKLMVLLDAGRDEVFAGEYRIAEGSVELLREFIAKLDSVVTEASALTQPMVSPDSKVVEKLAAAGISARLVAPVQADEIGRIGLRKLLAGDVVDPATNDANYIRRSDAELFSLPKH